MAITTLTRRFANLDTEGMSARYLLKSFLQMRFISTHSANRISKNRQSTGTGTEINCAQADA